MGNSWGVPACSVTGSRPVSLFQGAGGAIALRRARRQFQRLLHIEGECLRLVAGVAQRENPLGRRPRRPAVGLQLGRVAADPVVVHQRRRVAARPAGRLRKIVPIFALNRSGEIYISCNCVPVPK